VALAHVTLATRELARSTAFFRELAGGAAVVRKIPTPITSATTSAVAVVSPNWRESPGSWWGVSVLLECPIMH